MKFRGKRRNRINYYIKSLSGKKSDTVALHKDFYSTMQFANRRSQKEEKQNKYHVSKNNWIAKRDFHIQI